MKCERWYAMPIERKKRKKLLSEILLSAEDAREPYVIYIKKTALNDIIDIASAKEMIIDFLEKKRKKSGWYDLYNDYAIRQMNHR